MVGELGGGDMRAIRGSLQLVFCALLCASAIATLDLPSADEDLHHLLPNSRTEMLESSRPRRRLQPRVVEVAVAYLTPGSPVTRTSEQVRLQICKA